MLTPLTTTMPRAHPRATTHRRPATTRARGYGAEHERRRAQDAPLVAAGLAYCNQPTCLYPTRWIPPGTPWDEGHTDDRTNWIGPTHRKCNRTAGAINSNHPAQPPPPARTNPPGNHSRTW